MHLHPDTSTLSPLRRVCHAMCVVVGMLGWAIFLICVLVEATTSTRPIPGGVLTTLIPAGYSAWHVLREIPAYGRISAVGWLLFLAAGVALVVKSVVLIQDPYAAIFVASIGVVSAALVGAARFIAIDAKPHEPADEPAHPE